MFSMVRFACGNCNGATGLEKWFPEIEPENGSCRITCPACGTELELVVGACFTKSGYRLPGKFAFEIMYQDKMPISVPVPDITGACPYASLDETTVLDKEQ